MYGAVTGRKRPFDGGSPHPSQKRSHKKKTPVKKTYQKTKGNATEAGLKCCGRKNLAAYLRFTPKEGTTASPRPAHRRVLCSFCGHSRTLHSCIGCKQSFCMSPPTQLENPATGRKFRSDGPFCWHLVHGFKTWKELQG